MFRKIIKQKIPIFQYSKVRKEKDTFGYINVPFDKYWGAQTQRSLQNFKIGKQQMPPIFIKSFVLIKRAIAKVNLQYGLDKKISDIIIQSSDDILNDKVQMDNFPLVIWQTGSGTQTNMNVNEVIANRGNEILNNNIEQKSIHPNDHVNKGQSSNDTFPTAMHVATVLLYQDKLEPSLKKLENSLKEKVEQFKNIIKIGRTHTQDATPITLGQEFSGYLYSIQKQYSRLQHTIQDVQELAQGGTAVGTGLNSFEGFDQEFCQELNSLTNSQFKPSENKFYSLATNDALTEFHSSLSTLATILHKIANDIRFLGSGPRSGLGELQLPENEPGSSIMPGKVNPTQCEALTMLCGQVLGNDVAVQFANSNGHFELNVYRPLVIKNIIESMELLSDGMDSFVDHCLQDLQANEIRIKQLLDQSLMLVTSLNNHIGYDNSASIAKNAHKKGLSLKQSALELGLVTESDFDKWVRAEDMLGPKKKIKKQ